MRHRSCMAKSEITVFDGEHRSATSPSMSLLGLKAFAKHCRSLSSLTIAFYASTVPPLDYAADTILTHTVLTYLEVDMSPINDAAAVAGFVSVLFPNLVHIRTHDSWLWEGFDLDEISTDEEALAYNRFSRWKQVEAMLQTPDDEAAE
ncbi:hypothetical protein C8R45DRAFT_1028972 [Mycena sanguinolenta]|nr:hypothetical protein C8R45DRAFT_1028972 [Mycena sanguinolenta]